MYIGKLNEKSKVSDLHPLFGKAFEWITKNLDDLPPKGKHEVSEGIFAIVDEYETRSLEGSEFENHHKYIDIQVIVKGSEWILWTLPKEDEFPRSKDYSEDDDVELFTAKEPLKKSTPLLMEKGMFCILFPNDWHMPCVTPRYSESSINIKKIVVKVLFNH